MGARQICNASPPFHTSILRLAGAKAPRQAHFPNTNQRRITIQSRDLPHTHHARLPAQSHLHPSVDHNLFRHQNKAPGPALKRTAEWAVPHRFGSDEADQVRAESLLAFKSSALFRISSRSFAALLSIANAQSKDRSESTSSYKLARLSCLFSI